VGAYKKRGIHAIIIFEDLFALAFTHKSLSMTLNTEKIWVVPKTLFPLPQLLPHKLDAIHSTAHGYDYNLLSGLT
jgi:hypothetical protein